MWELGIKILDCPIRRACLACPIMRQSLSWLLKAGCCEMVSMTSLIWVDLCRRSSSGTCPCEGRCCASLAVPRRSKHTRENRPSRAGESDVHQSHNHFQLQLPKRKVAVLGAEHNGAVSAVIIVVAMLMKPFCPKMHMCELYQACTVSSCMVSQ